MYRSSAVIMLVLVGLTSSSVHGESPPTFVFEFGSAGSGNGEFNSPVGLAFDSDDNLYVVDVQNARVQKFAADGTFIGKWGSKGAGDGRFDVPRYVVVDAADNVYGGGGAGNRIQKFDSDGDYVDCWIAERTDKPQSDALAYFDAVPRSWSLDPFADYPDPELSVDRRFNFQ